MTSACKQLQMDVRVLLLLLAVTASGSLVHVPVDDLGDVDCVLDSMMLHVALFFVGWASMYGLKNRYTSPRSLKQCCDSPGGSQLICRSSASEPDESAQLLGSGGQRELPETSGLPVSVHCVRQSDLSPSLDMVEQQRAPLTTASPKPQAATSPAASAMAALIQPALQATIFDAPECPPAIGQPKQGRTNECDLFVDCPLSAASAPSVQLSGPALGLATVLAERASLTRAKHLPPWRRTCFHGTFGEWSDSIPDYLARIEEKFECSSPCFVLALVYIDRIAAQNPLMVINELTCHRLLLTSLMMAIKFHDDDYLFLYGNAFYAKTGGLDMEELNKMEKQFCKSLDWNFSVQSKEYDWYHNLVYSAAAAVI